MSTRRRSLMALIAVVVVASGAVAVSRRTAPETISSVAVANDISSLPVLTDAPPSVTASEWLNSAPLSAQDLKGKVVLYDFWTFGCINCVHTLPHVKAWDERYRADGLIVLSIHTPEFDYEAVPANVRRFVTENDIRYPVALDPDSVTWRAFANRYWPAFYLHDREGKRRYKHFGEGAYQQTEDTIRALLGVDPSSPRADVVT